MHEDYTDTTQYSLIPQSVERDTIYFNTRLMMGTIIRENRQSIVLLSRSVYPVLRALPHDHKDSS